MESNSNYYPQHVCVHQLFEAQVERTPDAIAAVYETQQLTYQELNHRANKIAHYLRSLGVGPDVKVGICVERSVSMVVGLLAILKAGGAYVPLDPAYPKERLAFMLEDARVPVLLTQQQQLEGLPQRGTKVVCLDADWEVIAQESQENPGNQATDRDLAYVIYTSGSTGKPKGVTIEHRSLVNFTLTASFEYAINKSDRVLQFASLGFDAAAEEIWTTLVRGATLVLRTREMLSSVPVFLQKCRDLELTVLDLPTAFWHQVSDVLSDGLMLPESLRLVIIGGERALTGRLATWQKHVDRRRVQLVNTYGPTEATIVTTMCELWGLRAVDTTGPVLPIGQPINNVQTYVLDQYLQPVAVGEPGEVYIGGAGLARGYLNRPALTAEKFIPNPFSKQPGDRLYKTGDLARYLPDGNIDYLGRIDSQVKIRGFRIELSEIEAVLEQHSAVREIVVIAREDEQGFKRLVAYLVAHHAKPTTSELRSFLKEKLPDYMVPSAFVFLEALPLTLNGKVDSQALPTPELSRPDLEKTFVAPGDTLELQLTKIWEEVLGIQPVGVRDNFFDLGGNSLLALRLFSQIEKICGKNLPLAVLFQAQTVEQLASILRKEVCDAPCSLLVEIQPGTSKPPLFCVHEVTGQVLFYRDLVQYLNPEQPVYAIQPQRRDGKPIFKRIEDMAAEYIQQILTLQPEGPYFLTGYSLGGLVAFEMAQQLYAQGQKVSLLALLDPPRPASMNFLRYCLKRFDSLTNFRFIPSLIYRCEYHSLRLSQLNKVKQICYVLNIAFKTIFKFPLAAKCSQAHPYQDAPGNHIPSEDYIDIEIKKYVAKAYPYPVTLFLSSETLQHFGDWGSWSELAPGGLKIYTVSGKHLTIIKEPYVGVLAEHLGVCLEQAQRS